MDTVNGICGNVYRTLETKGHVCAIDVIINSLWKMDNVQSFFSQKVCCLLCTISAKDHKAVQAEFIISLLHCFNLVQAILIRDTHQFEWLSGCSEDCAALCKDSGKIFGCEHTVFTIDQSFISIIKSINFQFIQIVTQSLYYSSHGSVKSLTVTATGKHTYSFNHDSILHFCVLRIIHIHTYKTCCVLWHIHFQNKDGLFLFII